MKILDMFCGAGGAAMGYYQACQDAGIDCEIVGVDINPQKRYPFTFIQADALEYCEKHSAEFDFIHASPPCQHFSAMTKRWGDAVNSHPNLIPQTRELIGDKPHVIENVVGAPLINPLVLCGTMFGLETKQGNQLLRHRLFELSFSMPLTPPCRHNGGSAIGVYGGGQNPNRKRAAYVTVAGHTGGGSKRDGIEFFGVEERREVMGIAWMSGKELSQAIPPAYTKFIMQHYLSLVITI